MGKFWVKIAVLAVIVLVLVILVKRAAKKTVESVENTRSFANVVEEDKKRFLAEPQQVREQKPTAPAKAPADSVQPIVKQAGPTRLYFKPLSEVEKIEAERLLNVAVPGRSIGRLPMAGFTLMLDTCRKIIRRWPDSWYAYRAKQILADMPLRYRKRYRITQEELDISSFAEPRPGTKPFNIKESR